MNINGLTAADFADTGQWRLILAIRPTGICAHLENTLHAGIEPQILFDSGWDADENSLLKNVENAVYDHPRVLEDFSARIVIYDRKVLFIPTEIAEETEGYEETCFTDVYKCEASDVMTETDGDITAVFSPAPGLKAFLNRTFPGARIGCNLMSFLSRVREGVGKRVCVSIREGEADLILLDGTNLLSASTHTWRADSDIAYLIANLLDVYGVDMNDTTLICDGGTLAPEMIEMLEKHGIQLYENN